MTNPRIVDTRSLRIERRLEVPVIIAALLTLPALLLEDSRAHTAHSIGYVTGFVLWLVFVAQVVVMLAVVPSRRQWLREHPLDVAIVVLTPPFLFTALQGLRVLRLLRLLRLIRIAPIARRIFTPEGLRYLSLLALLTLLISADAYSAAEKTSFGEGVYWAISTMTTVGYVAPHATAGKVVACIAMLIGVGFFAVITGAVAQRFLRVEVIELEEHEQDFLARVRDIGEQLRKLERDIARNADRMLRD